MNSPTPTLPPLPHAEPPISEGNALRWPADRFYWAVLETPGRLRSGLVPPGLLAALEDELPIHLTDLHAVCTPAREGRVLVCACPIGDLACVDPHVLSLTPESIPDGVEVDADITKLNLLVGEHESPMRRSARQVCRLLMMATLVICSGLATIGLGRRTMHARNLGIAAIHAADAILSQSTPDHREETLTANLGRLRLVADLVRKTPAPTDAAEGLEGVLKNWPSEGGTKIPCKPQSLTVSSDGVNIAVVVEGDPAAFLGALKPPIGFTLDEPRLTSVGELTRLSLHMRPVKGAAR